MKDDEEISSWIAGTFLFVVVVAMIAAEVFL